MDNEVLEKYGPVVAALLATAAAVVVLLGGWLVIRVAVLLAEVLS